ncbi:TPA: class I SAM-dependent methyltransferase, partial [Acinetobacter baumannii]
MMDFRDMPFKDGQFTLVVFDPPHLVKAGKQSWLAAKYGKLSEDWREDIRKGFAECFRVLTNGGVLIFKWNETQIKVSELLELTDQKPLFGHISGKRSNTHWITFMKAESKEG